MEAELPKLLKEMQGLVGEIKKGERTFSFEPRGEDGLFSLGLKQGGKEI